MAVDTKLFTIAGVTTHSGVTASGVVSERTKVRYGTDMIRLIKMLNSPGKIWDRPNAIGLAPVRVELVELPQPMTKIDALAYIKGAPEFQSAADQYVIGSELGDRAKAALREAKRATLTVSGGKPQARVVAKQVA